MRVAEYGKYGFTVNITITRHANPQKSECKICHITNGKRLLSRKEITPMTKLFALLAIALAIYLGWIMAQGLSSYHNQVARQIERVTIR